MNACDLDGGNDVGHAQRTAGLELPDLAVDLAGGQPEQFRADFARIAVAQVGDGFR